MDRRDFTKVALLGLAPAALASSPARGGCSFKDGLSLVASQQLLPWGYHLAYPHSNGFIDHETVVVAKGEDGGLVSYRSYNLRNQRSDQLFETQGARLYFAVSKNRKLAFPTRSAVKIADLDTGIRSTIAEWPEWTLLGGCDISLDGSKVLVSRYRTIDQSVFRVDLIDTTTGHVRNIASASTALDHAHFSPYDQAWIAYCDGRTTTKQRMWMWHEQKAPHGRSVFNQIKGDGKSFQIGHERAMFNRAAMIVVAYGFSSASPRGLYQVDFDGAVRLVSESNSDLHANVSVDGRFAVVSTLQAARFLNGELDLCEPARLNWLKTNSGHTVSDIAIVNMASGARRFLFRGSNRTGRLGRSQQPWEATPTISPDGRWVLANDSRLSRVVALELSADHLATFLLNK